jgi:D-alanyl-D-alanine carboxypeptidase
MRVLSVFALLTLMFAGACAASAPAPVVASSPAAQSAATRRPPPPPSAAVEAADAGFVDSAAAAVEPKEPAAGEAAAPASTSACNEQPPQDFLVRGNFLKEGAAGNQRAIQYRTEQYGYFKGFGRPLPGEQPPSAQVVSTTFMGLPIKMHRKVVPALACVEREIVRACADHPYTPHALAGIRFRNTYRGGEVTNHAYGIAIDIDPAINTCCGCVKPWSDAPACKRAGKNEYDHMAMPECWVHAFELFGFYWLGHDVLRDTMHFEFLGDPDKITPENEKVTSDAPPKSP